MSEKVDINAITGTKDKQKQGEAFLNILNAPVVDLVIRFDSRTGSMSLSVIGGKLEMATVYKILDAARDKLREEEIKVLSQKSATEE